MELEVGAEVLRLEVGAEVWTGRGGGILEKGMEVMVATLDMKELRKFLDLKTREVKVLTVKDTGEAVDINYLIYLPTYFLHMYIY